jgi:hypothetical protein
MDGFNKMVSGGDTPLFEIFLSNHQYELTVLVLLYMAVKCMQLLSSFHNETTWLDPGD